MIQHACMQAWMMVDSAAELSNLPSRSSSRPSVGLNIADWDPQWGPKVETPIIGSVNQHSAAARCRQHRRADGRSVPATCPCHAWPSALPEPCPPRTNFQKSAVAAAAAGPNGSRHKGRVIRRQSEGIRINNWVRARLLLSALQPIESAD